MPAETCPSCLRPRSTPADLQRWHDEGPALRPDPPWARDLCWTKPDCRCLRRPNNAPAIESLP